MGEKMLLDGISWATFEGLIRELESQPSKQLGSWAVETAATQTKSTAVD
jgi:hypothetical protein